jgi:hypothetical protein
LGNLGYALAAAGAGDTGLFRQLANLPLLALKPGQGGCSCNPGMVSFGQLQKLPTGAATLKAWITAFNRTYARQMGEPYLASQADFLKPLAIAVTPNGTTISVVNELSGTVTPVQTATNKPLPPIKAGSFPLAIAVTP